MKNTGKQLELKIRLVEESFKDSKHTKIYSNFKIPNQSGRTREIDVLVMSKINDFDICIAIECKDYKRKISVDKIEAFHSKCLRLPQINKMIFVSSNGYQEDAVLAAKDFRIELLTAESFTPDYIKQLVPIRQIKPTFHYEITNVVLSFAADEEKLKVISENCSGEIFRRNSEKAEDIGVIFADAMDKHRREIFGLALFEYLKMKDTHDIDIVTLWPPFGLKFEGYYIKHFEEHIELLDAQFNLKVDFKFIVPEQISGRSIKHPDGCVKADTYDIRIKEGVESHMVVKNDSKIEFFVTENNETRRLQTLFTYNPKTEKLLKSLE